VIVLGLDTATRTASVGLASDERELAERSDGGARRLAASVLPMVEGVLGEAGLEVGDVDLIAVSAGPGSFTGLRVGMSIAKGIALATGCEVVAVSTLQALAMVAGRRPGRICPVLDARRGEVYAALFGGERHERLIEDCAVPPERLAQAIDRPSVLLGDGVEPYLDTWRRRISQPVEFLPFSQFHPRGVMVARLGLRRYRERGGDALAELVPRYCRVPEAEQKRLAKLGDDGAKSKIDRLGGLG
jgi:tRNA threonylcarbamoyladenosine biosynthesis protein TsaB